MSSERFIGANSLRREPRTWQIR
ncbi:hypothetical protein LINPERPRIM_LOCUS21226 [Linum perenne]